MTLVEEITYEQDGSIYNKVVHACAPDRFVTGSIRSSHYSGGEEYYNHKIVYIWEETDSGYNKISQTTTTFTAYNNQTTTETLSFEYRTVDGEERYYSLYEDRTVKEYSVEQIGENCEEYTFTYNADDVITKYSEFKRDGNTSFQSDYDGNGNLKHTHEQTFNDDNKVIKRVSVSYDSDNSIIQTNEDANTFADGRRVSTETTMTYGNPYGSVVKKTMSECKYELR